MVDESAPHRAAIPAPGVHGGDAWRLAAALGVPPGTIVDLSLSTNPFAPDVGALISDLIVERPEALTSYPDQTEAATRFAAEIGEHPARVVLTNGGAEAIALVAAIEGTGHVVGPEFSLYERHLSRLEPGGPRWRSNPSNPLGRLADAHERARVWDEAFYPIATGRWTRGDTEGWRLGSLTKLWSCPGLRLGYVIAPTVEAADELRRIQPRWSVNGLALAALPALLDATDLAGWAAAICDLGRVFAGRLRGIGFSVETTDANWVLVHRAGVREALARHRVLVRDCASFGLTGLARVALPRPDELELVVEAFGRAGP